MIGLVTDSSSQLPPALAKRYGVEIVPMTVSIDGTDFLEGVEIDADAFYDRLTAPGPTPTVKTSQPSPGLFATAYEALADRGATQILSVHLGSTISGTVNSARLAATLAPLEVEVVDTGTASFGVSCCLWEAAHSIAGGATLAEAAEVARHLGPRIGNVFVVKALELAQAGGRLDIAAVETEPTEGVPVLTLTGDTMEVIGTATTIGDAADAMAAHVGAAGNSLRVGVGVADSAAESLAEALRTRLDAAAQINEVVPYRVGPSIGAHTGPGTVGAMYYESPGSS